jgi:predicted transglutaminase-like cysteine proteinase
MIPRNLGVGWMLGGLTRTFLLSIAVLAFGFAPASMHGSAQADDLRTESAPVGAVTTMPYGWADFCGRHADECRVEALQPVDIVLTPKVMRTLRHINAAVNAAIEPVSNLDHWGTMLDHWDYPTDGKGDCKIYALQKRKMLIEMGFPRQALLMTIVRDQEDNGHTILTVKTDKGDFVLDNMVEDIRAWDMTGYQFVKRQSQSDPNVWVSIGTSSAPRTTAAAVTASRSLN